MIFGMPGVLGLSRGCFSPLVGLAAQPLLVWMPSWVGVGCALVDVVLVVRLSVEAVLAGS